MNRQEAAEYFARKRDTLIWGLKDNRDETRQAHDAYNEAIDALCGPRPDPITGLVPCGCGGVTEQTDFHDGFFHHSKVECLECGVEMMRAGDTILEAHAEVKRDWNTAMGHQEATP